MARWHSLLWSDFIRAMISRRFSLCSEFVFKSIDLFINLVFFSFCCISWGLCGACRGDCAVNGSWIAILYACAQYWGLFYVKDSCPFGWWDQHHLWDAHSQLCKGLNLHGGICLQICVQVNTNTVLTWTAGWLCFSVSRSLLMGSCLGLKLMVLFSLEDEVDFYGFYFVCWMSWQGTPIAKLCVALLFTYSVE